ncbi:MAG TPA: amino acid adenylation domain-containing protein [Terriglobia bacterium]|nr:amino acid adenylation domain-containing protein [Terriglobia bacterium]
MHDNGSEGFDLTTAQRGLWFTQRISPGATLNLAEAAEICGQIQPVLFQRALRQVLREAEQLRVRIIERNGHPLQMVRPSTDLEFPYLDFSGHPDANRAIQRWMADEVARPVDLAREAPWVSALLKAADSHYFWYHRAHHTVCDGYGGGMIALRLAEVYTAYAKGIEPEAHQFATVQETVEAERAYRDSRHFQKDREYWLQQLEQLPEAATLSRTAHRHGLSDRLLRSTGHLSVDAAQRVAEIAKSARISAPQVLISIIATYYQRFTRARELVFGMPVSGRINSVLRRAVGVCANLVPIRLSFGPETTFPDLMGQVSKLTMAALRHQQYRYEDLRRDLGLLRQDQNIAWLGINIEPFDYRLNFDGASTTLHNLSNSSIEDLVVFVYDRGTDSGLRFDLDANPLLYSAAEIEEHRGRLSILFEQVLANPGKRLADYSVIAEEERRRLVIGWNQTSGEVPDAPLPAAVARWAAETPDATAVEFEGVRLSYRQLHERSVRQARGLVAKGVKPGDVVAIALPRSERLLTALLAVMRTGAAYLPLDLDSPRERTGLVLDDASPALVIVEGSDFAGFRIASPDDLETVTYDDATAPDLSTAEGRVYLLYTSGSTGRPKGVEIVHRNLSNFLEGMRQQLRPTADSCFLALTPVSFDISGLELFLPLTVGARVVIAPRGEVHNPSALARLVGQCGVTHVQATPSVWRILLASPQMSLKGVHALVGGESLSADLAALLKARAPRVTQFYGPTETTIWSTAFELQEVTAKAPPIGRPILNTQLYVLDEQKEIVLAGAVGELYIGGAGVAKGYFKRPELTEERFISNVFTNDGSRMFRTGDLVRWSTNGQLEFIGRADEQVKLHGRRIELGEIESVLLQHPAVAQAGVAAHCDERGAVSLSGYLVWRSGASADLNSIRIHLAARLPAYMIPASFTILDQLPLTPHGKLNRAALPKPERTASALSAEPATPVQKKLAALWARILQADRVGLHDNFFELGGDSLTAAQMAAEFPSWFATGLPVGALFEAPTIAALAPTVEQLNNERADSLRTMLCLRKGEADVEAPLFCVHPAIGLSMGFSALLRHLDPLISVYGLQSRGLRGEATLPGSISEIAADYLDQIRRVQANGPYRLVGRSLGGLIAYEMAEQLRARGERVELLALIDTFLFITGPASRTCSEADEVQAALAFLDIEISGENAPRTLKELAAYLMHPDHVRAIPLAQGAATMAHEMEKIYPGFVERLCGVLLNNIRLAQRYVPRKLGVDLVYFRATEVTGNLEGIVDRSPSVWQQLVTGKVDVYELGCHHEAVLDPIPAAQIARTLERHLSLSREALMPNFQSEAERQTAAANA